MKILVLSLLAVLFVAGAAHAAAAPAAQTPSHADARAVLQFLEVARGYGTCVLRCEDRYKACVATASSDEARRSCRLDWNLCEADCGRFGSR